MHGLRRIALIALFLGLLVGGWGFAGKNLEPVAIDYLFGTLADIQLWKALLGAGLLGIAGAALPLTLSLLRVRLEARRYRREMIHMEAELKRLQPVADPVQADPLRSPSE
jgi:uncharacterized integral membrane protein